MIVCDKCKKVLEKHRVIEFGYVGTVWEKNPNWDLCEECEKEVLNIIKETIKCQKTHENRSLSTRV